MGVSRRGGLVFSWPKSKLNAKRSVPEFTLRPQQPENPNVLPDSLGFHLLNHTACSGAAYKSMTLAGTEANMLVARPLNLGVEKEVKQ